MSITGFFLRNRYAIWALVVGTVIAGFAAYARIPVRLFPDTAPPLVNVVTVWPGATAADVARDLSDVLETEFASLDGVAESNATSQDNLSVVQIEFQYGTDVELAAVDVQNAVSRILGDLPDAAELPRVLAFSTADRPIYSIGVSGEDLLEARRLAEDVIGPRLQSVRGVAAVDVFGGRVPSVLVDVDPQKSEAHHVSLPQIAGALKSSNVSLPAGRIRAESTETMLRVDQRRAQFESLEDVTLTVPGGGRVRLGSVARVYLGAEKDDSWFSINGERAIALQVFRSQDANTVEVVGKVRTVVAELESEFPEFKFTPGEESASFTEQSVSNLLTNVWQALLLASVILFLFLGRARAALVTAFTMPLAFGLTFATMWQLGMEFNMVTLTAVILAVGMVVDASVVVLENITRLKDEGYSPEKAAQEGTDQVWGPVIAGTATTLVVLIPLLSLEGFVGKVFGPLAMTLLIAFSSSVIVALLLVPILSLSVSSEGRIERMAQSISWPFRASMDLLKRIYLRVLDFGLRWRTAILALAMLSFVGGVVGLRSIGMDLLPRMDGGTFTVSIETPSGTSLEETIEVVQQVEVLLAKQPEVTLVQSQAGFESGMKFSGGSGVMGSTQGFLSITLQPRTERKRSIWQIETQLRAQIDRIPGIANVVVKEVGNTAKPTTLAPIVARISGPDPRVLEKLGDEVVQRLTPVQALVRPTPTWRRDMRRIIVHVDEQKAALLGQSSSSVARLLASGAEGIPAGTWTKEGTDSDPIVVRYAPGKSPDLETMLSWPLFAPKTGDALPLRAIAETETVIEQGLYSTVALNPTLDVLAQIGDRPLSFVVSDAQTALEDMSVPAGYKVAIEGENSDLVKSRTSILSAISVSVLAVYLLLVAQFRSWLHPVTVMMAVPLSLSGVALALIVVGKPVSMPVMVGLVLLVGTVVNNSILLVDVIRELRNQGVPRREAIRKGVAARFRPIMMTSISTVVGMLPLAAELALGAERFSPLATAVIGGLLVSTLLTMIVIPILYDVAESFQHYFENKKARSGASPVVAGALVLLATLALPSPASAQTEQRASTLVQAWELAQSHPAAASANLQIEAAESAQSASTRRMFPKLEIKGRASQASWPRAGILDTGQTQPDGTPAPVTQFGDTVPQHLSIAGSLTQPIYSGGALMQGRAAAKAGLRAAEAGKKATDAELWFGLVQTWYGYLVAQELTKIQKLQLSSAVAREKSQERMVAQGRSTPLELSSVSLKRAEAEQRLLEAESEATSAKYALQAFLDEPVIPASVDVLQIARSLQAVKGQPAGSPQIARALANSEAAQARAKAINSKYLPQVALVFRAEYANPSYRYIPIEDKFQGAWDASIIVNWTIDAGANSKEAKSAKLQAAASRAQADALKRQTQVEIARAQATLSMGPPQLRIARERVTLAESSVARLQRALDQGRATATDLLEREAELGQARAAEQRIALTVILNSEKVRTLSGDYGPQ